MITPDFVVCLSPAVEALLQQRKEPEAKKNGLDKSGLAQSTRSRSADNLTKTVTATKASIVYLPPHSTKPIPKPITQYRVEKSKEMASSLKPIQKSHSLGIQVLAWLGNTWLAHLVVFKSVCLLKWLGEPSAKARSATDTQIDEMSGSLHLSKLMQGLSPWIAGIIKEKCMALQLPHLVKDFLVQEPHALQAFVSALLPHLCCNIMHSIRSGRPGLPENQQPITLVEVVSLICGIIDQHLPSIQQQMKSLEILPEGNQRDKIIEDAFSGIIQEFLGIALPNGVKDLPLPSIPRLSPYFWEIVQKHVLPKIGYELYHQMVLPIRAENREELLQKTGGESLVSLAQVGGRQAVDLLPSLIVPKKSEGNKTAVSPIVDSIVKSVCGLLAGSDQLKTWMTPWMSSQLHAFSSHQDPHLQHMWKLLGSYCEALIVHVFTHMSRQAADIEIKGRIPDVMGIISIRLLSVCSHFINGKHEQIKERISFLKDTRGNPKNDPELLRLFQPLVDDLLHLMGLDQAAILPVPDFVKLLLARQLKEMAPVFVLDQYCAMMDSSIDDRGISEQLRTLLFDPKHLEEPAVAIDVISMIYKNHELSSETMFHEFYHNLWRASGTAQLANTLKEICGKMASGLVDSSMKHLGVSDQLQLDFSHNPMMKALDERLKVIVKTAFLEALVHLMGHVEERVPKESDDHPKALIAINALFQLHTMACKKLAGIQYELSQIVQRHPYESEAYKQEANKLFSGLAVDLHAFIGVNPFKNLPLDGLPGGSSLKDALWTSMKTAVLPTLLHQTYRDLVGWQSKTETFYEELEQLYHTSHPKWACKVLAQYATDFIRHYLLHSGDEVAKLIVEVLGLQELKDNGEFFISQNIHAAAASEDPHFTTLWPAIARYAEAIFAKVFADISKTIQDIELDHPDFTVDAATQILKETADHFAVVAKVTEEWGVDQAFQVPLADMLAAFGNRLHPGIPVKPSDPAHVKDRVRLQGCFILLAKKLLELANLSIQDLPIPSALQKPVGELILNKIFPLILMRCYQKACEPQVRNVLMLHFVQTLYAALNGVKPPKKEQELQEATSQLDPKKKHLYETCGSVVLELVKLIPDTAVQYVFMKEKVKNMSAEAIGNAIMPYLSRWSLLHMIDSAIYAGLPNFHPAKWEGKQGREDLVPRKISVRPDGKMELKPVKDFKFHFAPTSTEMTRYEQQKALEAAKLRRELRDGFTRTISQQLYEKLWAVIRSLWESMQGQLNDFIERMFPEKGRDVKAALDKVFRKIFFDILGTIILFLTTPIVALGKFGMEKIIIDRRSENIIENLQTETLESLFYKWNDSVFDVLVSLHRQRKGLGSGL